LGVASVPGLDRKPKLSRIPQTEIRASRPLKADQARTWAPASYKTVVGQGLFPRTLEADALEEDEPGMMRSPAMSDGHRH